MPFYPYKFVKSIFIKLFVGVLIFLGFYSVAFSIENAPWGEAKESNSSYKPQKVLYDLSSGDETKLVNILDRVSYLYKLYGSDPFETSIVIILHGPSIPFFTKALFANYKNTMTRAQSLTVGDIVEFRMCQASAKLQGFKPSDIHGFVKMVPMADAEIIKLQKEEDYAYMQ